jgi:replicative DNA helicase
MSENGQLPPHDLDAEAAVLSAILIASELSKDPLTPDVVSDLVRPESFYSRKHGDIFRALTSVHARREPVNIVTVGSELRATGRIEDVGGMPALTEILNAAPVIREDALRSHAKSVCDLAALRDLLTLAHVVRAECYEGVGDPRAYIDRVAGKVSAIAADRQADAFEHIRLPLKRGFTQAREAAKSSLTGEATITTGIVALNRYLGGWHPGDLTIVAGRPGMGKSAFAFSRMVLLAETPDTKSNGETFAVAGVSREMPNEQIAMRLACAKAGVSLRKLRAGECTSDDWNKLTWGATETAKLRDVWLSDKAKTVPEVRAGVRRLQADAKKRGARVGLVVVDYIQLMRGVDVSKGRNRENEVAEISRGLKELAMDLGVPVMGLAQLNRAVEARSDKRPLLADLRESGAIEQDADNILFLYRDEYYDGGKMPGVAEIAVAKQRNGPTGVAYAHFDAKRTSFRDLTDDERNQAGVDEREERES